ncbi:MAG: hypothetical protein F6K09_13270 [Merismopedia sp. SIO2A8]|nr:hypothetical protein [Merismopedia sp. SIO2A8]
MHDNKVRLSKDVLDKAQIIADEWGLKNSRAAVEAVFRRYSDDYLHGRNQGTMALVNGSNVAAANAAVSNVAMIPTGGSRHSSPSGCEALNELDDLLAM